MSRIIIPHIFLIVLIILSCGKQAQDSRESDLALVKDQIIAAEDAYVAAELNRDEKALNMLVDDHFVYNSANGMTTGKKELISAVLNMNMVDQTITERTAIVEDDLGIIFGTAELKFQAPGEESHLSKLRYTSVYVKRGEQWKMLALQMQPYTSN